MADNASSSADLDISDLDDSAFDNNSRWPRRLLHLPTWTSYKWQPGNIYGGHLEPKYVALSYTWGRWQLPEGAKPQTEALPIRGVPWTIPRVDPDLHFALTDFINVLHEVVQDPLRRYYYYAWRGVRINSREGWGGTATSLIRWLHKFVSPPYQFIWLDIACIDQRYNKITLAEIGRQARIFQHAEHVYVWLSRTSHERLESLMDDLQTGVVALEIEPYMKSQTIEQISRTKGLLDQILRGLKGLLEDPWFTSLWTLQEAYLCPKAIMLSRDGCPVSDRGVALVAPRSQTLNNIFSHANNLAFWSTRTLYARNLPQYQPVIELIRKAGLAVLWMNNPMALLGVSHSRKVTRELDYVYGIMQIFDSDFRVGNTRFEGDQNHAYTLAELEDEFGAAIVDKFPILSQMYVYLEMPAFGKGWCVQATSTVPEVLDRGDMFGWTHGASNRLAIDCRIESFTLCSLTTRVVGDIRWAYLSGKACEFSSLQQEWRKADNSSFAKAKQRSYWRMHRRSQPSIMMISLDKGYRREDILGEEDKPVILAGEVEEREHKLAEWITEQFQSLSPKVFLLGRSEFGDEAFHTGLILFEREDRGIKHWHRIGVCIWLTSHLTSAEGRYPGLPLMIGESEGWKHIEGLMG